VFKRMSPQTAWGLFGASMVVLVLQALILCPTGFAPGWANGWPGISKHTVFAGFMTGMLLLAQIAVATGLLALPCFVLDRIVKKNYVGWSSFLASMTVALLIALYVCSRAYPAIRAAIAKDWP
jgi:hypothetical protein